MDAQFAFVQPDHALFADTWSSRLAPSTPECSQYYIDALVSSEPDKQHLWVLGQTSDGEPIAVAYFSIQAVEFVLGSMVKVLTLGGSLSANAFWIDTSRAAYENVMREMLRFCAKHLRYHVVLLKPFDASQQATPLLHNEKDLGFINVYASTQAEVDLSGIESYEGYTATLEKKKRYYLRKVQKDADLSGLRVEITEDFAAAVPEIYPLYLSVNERASEMKDNDPLPPQYLKSSQSFLP